MGDSTILEISNVFMKKMLRFVAMPDAESGIFLEILLKPLFGRALSYNNVMYNQCDHTVAQELHIRSERRER